MTPQNRRSIASAVFETLEGRRLMSAAINFHSGLLVVEADPNTASRIQVRLLNESVVRASVNAEARSYPVNQVRAIQIIGSEKDDFISIDPLLGLPASIDGGAGNDVILGGSGFDTINGGSGDDVIQGHGILSAGSGNSIVRATRGKNTITGGPGNDLLIGGTGHDTIYGGTGHSTLIAGAASDTLHAQSADNVLFADHQPGAAVKPASGTTHHEARPKVPAPTPTVPRPKLATPRPKPIAHRSPRRPVTPPRSPTTTTTSGATRPGTKAQGTTTTTTGGTGSGSSADSAPTTRAVITQLEQSITAGEGVEVNAFNSALHVGTPLTTQYHWDFGDPSGRYNDLTGWNAGHIYDVPGTYKVTLDVTDAAGQSSIAVSMVNVAPDIRPVIYVDNNGVDSNDGATPKQAVETAARAFQLAGSNTKVEFRRGQTFHVNQTLMLNGHDIFVGAYGAGAEPVLMRDAGDGPVTLFIAPAAYNTTIDGLTFDSPNPAVNGVGNELSVAGVWAGSTNVVVRGCTFLNLEDDVDGEAQPHGIIVQDNTSPLMTGLRGYFCWVDGTDWSILGNTVANTTRQHVVRGNDMAIKGVLIADNDFAKVCRAEDPAEIMKTVIDFRAGSYIYVAHNMLRYGTVAFYPDEIATANESVSWVVVENNWMSGQLKFGNGVYHAMVRNNILTLTGTCQIDVVATDITHYNAKVTDLTITHNTGLTDATGGQFLEVAGPPSIGAITLTDNLLVAPHLQTGVDMAAAVLIDSPDLSSFALIAGNVWPIGAGGNQAAPGAVNYAAGSWFMNSGWLSPAQWDAESNVRGDVFQSVTLPANVYRVNTPSGTAGASGPVPGQSA